MAARLRQPLSFLVAFLAGTGLLVAARQTPAVPSPATGSLSATIPVDPAIAIGQLPNGLKYYVRANKQPQDRAILRLVVNAGSLLEEDDQRGLAHFVEHMAFNGTKHFPKDDIISFIQSAGMRFGSDLNASTSFDETTYMLDVPTDSPAVLDKAMLVLQDWAHDVTFDPVEIDKERGVIMEEWRLGRGANARIQDKQFPVLLQGSRYAERIPIGLPDVIQNFKPPRLVQFYKDWYRPDLMAVVAVGDFDPKQVEQSIRSHFETIPRATAPRPRPNYAVPAHAATLYSTVTDKEARTTSVSVYETMPAPDQSTIGAYRQQQVVEELFDMMLNARLGEIGQKPNAPFLGAGTSRGLLVRTASAATLSAVVKDTGVADGLTALFTEAERVARFGFTQTEFDRQKTNLLRSMERAVAEKEDRQSDSLAAEYIRNFLQKEPIPGIDYESALYKRFVPDIKLSEMNDLARTWTDARNRVVLVSAPDSAAPTMPSTDQLAKVMTSVKTASLTAWADTTAAAPLLATPPTPGSITSTSSRAEFGITDWTLSNGVHVILKPTTYKQDEVLFRAFAPGGTSLATDADYLPASTATSVVANGGLGQLSATDVRKVLTGKAASAAPFIGDTDQGLSGSASPQDLETMFQLIYLRFTAPRADPQIFGVLTDQLRTGLANQANTPEFAFSTAVTDALYGNTVRTRPMTPDRVSELNLDKSMAFYKARFADASRFTFVFVGSFDPAVVRPLIEKYVASLPATHGSETWRDDGVHPLPGLVERTVNKGIEPKSQATIIFHGPFQYNQVNRIAIRAMSMVLQDRLRNTLREDLGGTYSVSASPGYTKTPKEEYTFSISFGCDPSRTTSLVERTFQEIEGLKAAEPSEQVVADIREQLKRTYETSSRENSFYLSEIAARTENGENLSDLFSLPTLYDQLTGAQILEAARTYLDLKNYAKIELFPEKTAAAN